MRLDELRELFSSANRSIHFSIKDERSLHVMADGVLVFEKDTNDTEGLLPIRLQACHIGENANKTTISEESMTAALPSIKNRPIMAKIHYVNGKPEFYEHNRRFEEGKTIYEEIPVGIIPESCNVRLEYDEEKEKTYVVADGYIYEEFSEAAEILEREEACDVSVELEVRDMSYSSEEDLLVINDFYFSAVTILGKDEDGNKIYPGMEGSNITIADFSLKENDVKGISVKLDKIMQALNINDNYPRKEEVNLFEKLLEKFNVTVDDIDFDYENMTDEELENAFSEKFGDSEQEDKPEESKEDVTYSIDYKKTNKTFSIILSEVQAALCELVNSDSDVWYSIDADLENNYVYMTDCWAGKSYRQSYICEDGVYSLLDDKVEVFSVYMTKEEKGSFDEMQSTYSDMKNELDKYHEEPQKMEILSSDEYNLIAEDEDFLALKENHFDLTIEEVTEKANEILLEAAKKTTTAEFALKTKKVNIQKRTLPYTKTGKRKRYGGIKFNND